jgi:DNA-binding transcriptional MerR regulator
MSAPAAAQRSYRIGEVAARVGTTPRTIRYYEEIGLLPAQADHVKGRHRLYDEGEVARLRELLRLRDLLGVSLEALKELLDAEQARADLRDRWRRSSSGAERREILKQALEHVDAQLSLVHARRDALAELEHELGTKRRRLIKELC